MIACGNVAVICDKNLPQNLISRSYLMRLNEREEENQRPIGDPGDFVTIIPLSGVSCRHTFSKYKEEKKYWENYS